MTALIGATPTAWRELGDRWRDRIEHELASGVTETAERIYGVLIALSDRPTYDVAWKAVEVHFDLETSDIRKTTFQTIFDLLWQTLTDPWPLPADKAVPAPWALIPC